MNRQTNIKQTDKQKRLRLYFILWFWFLCDIRSRLGSRGFCFRFSWWSSVSDLCFRFSWWSSVSELCLDTLFKASRQILFFILLPALDFLKKLSLCHKLWFFNPYIFATRFHGSWMFQKLLDAFKIDFNMDLKFEKKISKINLKLKYKLSILCILYRLFCYA